MRNIRITLTLLIFTLPQLASADPIVRSGADAANGLTNTNNAFGLWSSDVGGLFELENMDDSTLTGFLGGTVTTGIGNAFTSSANDGLSLFDSGPGFGVLVGPSLRLSNNTQFNDGASLTWDIVAGVDAFGFFARSNDRGLITIAFENGMTSQYDLTSPGSNDNLFWGISGLTSAISQVTITTTDPGDSNNSFWDRFVYTPAATVSVPEPGTLALFGAGLLGMGLARRRRKT